MAGKKKIWEKIDQKAQMKRRKWCHFCLCLPVSASSSSGSRHTYAHAQRTHTYADTMTERGDDMETNYAV